MALKVVGTNKVCKSRIDCNRPQTPSLPPSEEHSEGNDKTRKTVRTGVSVSWAARWVTAAIPTRAARVGGVSELPKKANASC